MEQIRLVLAEDHPIMRQGLRYVLSQEPDLIVVGEAARGEEALRLATQLLPDVLLLDIELEGMSGLDVARRLRASGSPVRVLAFSAHDDMEYIMGLLDAGAAGYLLKDDPPQALLEAVRGVARGEVGWLSRRVARKVMLRVGSGRLKADLLTARQREVLRLVVEGKTNHQIAQVLGISEKTVEKHLAALFAEMGVTSRVGAAVYAVRQGFVADDTTPPE